MNFDYSSNYNILQLISAIEKDTIFYQEILKKESNDYYSKRNKYLKELDHYNNSLLLASNKNSENVFKSKEFNEYLYKYETKKFDMVCKKLESKIKTRNYYLKRVKFYYNYLENKKINNTLESNKCFINYVNIIQEEVIHRIKTEIYLLTKEIKINKEFNNFINILNNNNDLNIHLLTQEEITKIENKIDKLKVKLNYTTEIFSKEDFKILEDDILYHFDAFKIIKKLYPKWR